MADVTGVRSSATGPGREGRVPGDAARPARTVRRRRSLPSGRAVVGAFLVALATVGTYAAYTDATAAPDTSYVVAARTVAVGTRLAEADLDVVPIRLPDAQRRRAFDDVGVLLGATVVAPLASGDLVQASDVVRSVEGGVEEVSLALPADRALGGRISPGETLSVVATYGGASGAYTAIVVRSALVVSVAGGGGDGGIGGGGGGIALTLAVPRAVDALALTHAVNTATVSLVRPAGPEVEGPRFYRPPLDPPAEAVEDGAEVGDEAADDAGEEDPPNDAPGDPLADSPTGG